MSESSPETIHLHVRSGFSYGLGVATPEELVARAAELAESDAGEWARPTGLSSVRVLSHPGGHICSGDSGSSAASLVFVAAIRETAARLGAIGGEREGRRAGSS